MARVDTSGVAPDFGREFVRYWAASRDSLLDELGTRDTKGALWYDRMVFGAKKQDITMPTGFVIDASGTVVYSYRATTVDDRPDPDRILANL